LFENLDAPGELKWFGVRDAGTSTHPFTFGAEIEGQNRLLNEKSGPSGEVSTGGSFVLGGCRCCCFDAVMHGQPSRHSRTP